nr:hypothetical protein [Tanacetum cinerariifolium]
AALVDVKARLPALRCVSHHLDGAAQVEVGVPGRCQAVQVGLGEVVAGGDIAPERRFVGQLRFQRVHRAIKTRRLDAKPRGQPRPQPAPAEIVAVGDVEGFVASRFGGGRPGQLLGNDAGIGHVRQAFPLRPRAGPLEGLPGFFANAGVGGQRGTHVHGVAYGLANDGVRAVNAPGWRGRAGRRPRGAGRARRFGGGGPSRRSSSPGRVARGPGCCQ